MPVQLEAIAFNHDAQSARTDALNVRRNGRREIPVPEWRRGETFGAAASPAAYSISGTAGNTITVRAVFRATQPAAQVQVRAIAADTGPGVLGVVRAQTLALPPPGQTVVAACTLDGVQLEQTGVGAFNIGWRWQGRRTPRAAWQDLAVTRHRIYALLDVPTGPWLQLPDAGNVTQLPWTDVLDHACAWAFGATNAGQAAARVTRRVNQLGLRYNCPAGGATQYAWPNFNCTAFLDLLDGGLGAGGFVNCIDCATIVSTFANSLGCDLWQSQMGEQELFATNEVLTLGSTQWDTPCGLPGFWVHEVAWSGGCAERDPLFDACLRVDGDGDPTQAPHVPELAAPMVFGAVGEGLYRDRLVAPPSRQSCVPQPSTRRRRLVV